MTVGELQKIHRDGPEIIETMAPILLEYEYKLMEQFFNNPKMTPGEIRKHFSKQFDVVFETVQAELRSRDKKI